MSTHDLKLQQSSCQSGVTCVLSDQERFHAHTDKSRFQNKSEQEKLHPGPSAQHIHNKKDLETRPAASSPALPSADQQKSSKHLQIKQIILLRSKKDTSRTFEEQKESARFTSSISISLPTRRHKKDTAEEKKNLYSTLEVVKNTANQHNTEIRDVVSPTEQCGNSSGELFKDGDGPKANFDEDSFTTLHQHVHNTPKQGQNTEIQHNIGLHEQIKIIHVSQRHSTQPVCEVQTEVNKDFGVNECRENAPTTPQYHSNLTSIGVDCGLKTSTASQLFACHAEVLEQALSLPSFTAPDSENTPDPEPCLFNPSSDMLTSALASVLAPPWSGRLRRAKQGSNEVEHVPQDCGQNINPSSLFRQDWQQQLFLSSQRQPSEHMLANDNEMQLPAGTSFNSPDWQKENNSPNVTTTVQPKRPILKSSSIGMMYNNTELHPFYTPLDTRQTPNSADLGYRISKTGDENESFKSLSSKPTTSSLLLSLRRTNSRSSSAEPTQTQTPITRSVSSLTMPNRIILKTQSFTHCVNTEDQTGKYPDNPTRTEEIPASQFPFSPRIKSRMPLSTTLFQNKPETEISNRLETSVAEAEEEHFPQSIAKMGQIGFLEAQQSSYSVLLRKYSSTEDIDPVEQRSSGTVNNTNLQNINITKQKITPHNTISPKDSTYFNVQHLKSKSTQNITASNSSDTSTFTDRLNFSPKKDCFVDGLSPTTTGTIYLDSKKHSQFSQSSMDLSSPISPNRPLRSVRVPSIYSYLRQSSPAVSTPSPFTPSPHIERAETLPPKQDGDVTLQGDRKTFPSRFSFDNSFVPQVQTLQRSSYGSRTHVTPAQSLPPDFGKGSTPRLSTSPYSSLISSRPALNNTLQGLSFPPVSKTHTRSTSYDIVTADADLTKGDPNSSLPTYTRNTRRPKEQLASPNREQRTAVQAHTSTLDNHRPAQPCLLQTAPNASLVVESKRLHPRQPNTGSNNFPHQEQDGLMALHLDKGDAYPKQRLSEKAKYLQPNNLTEKSGTPLTAEKETTAVHMHDRLQEIQNPNSKKGLFALRIKKDFSSASLPDKDVVSPQYLKTKRHSPVFKTNSRIDQILNRLKLTFSVKRSDRTLDTVMKKNKSPTQQHSDTETIEKPKTQQKTYSGSQREPSNSSLTTDKASLGLLSPLTLKKSENTLNMDRQNKSTTEQKYYGCTWEAPDSSLNTDKGNFATSESLSPSTLSENKFNVDQQKRHSDENGNRSYSRSFSPHRLNAQCVNRSTSLPHYRKSSVGPPSPFYLFDFDSEDIQNDNVFYSPVSKKTNSLCEFDNFSPLSSAKSAVQQNLVRSQFSSSCADLKYGMHSGRSYSVSGVFSSRPSGPGRISTSSISDLSSLDDLVPKENYAVVDSPVSIYSPSYAPKSVSGIQFQPGYTDDRDIQIDHDDSDPTPPPSPTSSSSPRRISQASAMSSLMRTTPETLSPRGILPSRNYSTSLTVFEESDSDTTTDDEYYVGNGDEDEVETEL